MSVNGGVKYTYFMKRNDDDVQWMLMVGFGKHTHVDTIPRSTGKAVEAIIRDKLQSDANKN